VQVQRVTNFMASKTSGSLRRPGDAPSTCFYIMDCARARDRHDT
jgi:hypothetical protein